LNRIRFAVAAIAAVSALVVAGPAAAATKLVGTVGPGFTITLTMGGKKVTSLKAGTYTVTIRDKSNFHNFHLRGAGLNKTTSVTFVGTKTWTLSLKKGKYTYVCDPHRVNMKGSFTVT
jgi:plastocyanin